MAIEMSIHNGIILIDEEYAYLLFRHKWYLSRENHGRYVVRTQRQNKKQIMISLHREIMNFPIGKQVDHINGNRLDNRKCNLRICSISENLKNQKRRNDNTSNYKGVYWNKEMNKWRALISVNNKRKHLGYYVTPELAYAAYCEAAKKYHGEFANYG